MGTQKKQLPSRSSSSTPPFASITRRDAALSDLAVHASRVDAELGGQRQRRRQHRRRVAPPPRRRPHLEPDVAAVVQQVRRQPVTDREPAEELVPGDPPECRHGHVAVDPLARQRRAVQLREVEVRLAGALDARVDGGAVPRELLAVLESLRLQLRVPPLGVVLVDRLQHRVVEADVRPLEVGPGGGRRRRLAPPARAAAHQRSLSPGSSSSTARKASCGTSTTPSCFMRFLPSFCFSSSLRLRLMSPP